ncbi:MAG: hypothetical protein HOQ45_09185 [Nocardioidaceae bacterium]|nr:hypothetical protein [Nocardioidaceae bacterium]
MAAGEVAGQQAALVPRAATAGAVDASVLPQTGLGSLCLLLLAAGLLSLRSGAVLVRRGRWSSA